jgi:hypothetical protein
VKLFGAVLLMIVGFGAAYLMYSRHVPPFNPPPAPHPRPVVLQAPGDPPVIVGDGSLHVSSKNDWAKAGGDIDDKKLIRPLGDGGNAGSLQNPSTCSMPGTDPVLLWADDLPNDQPVPLSANADQNLVVQIYHANIDDSAAGPTVTISKITKIDSNLPTGNRVHDLRIETDQGKFEVAKNGKHAGNHRSHDTPSRVSKIVLNGNQTNPVWTANYGVYGGHTYPVQTHHYSVYVCYH